MRGVAEQVGLPLVGVTADEAIEIFKTHAGRPLIERANLARGECRRVVVLAEPRRRVPVLEKNAADRGFIVIYDAVVAGKASRLLRDYPKPAEWSLRPVMSAARVGEHSAVEKTRV